MSGFLFEQVVFGPIRSRRLGISLGINLLPADCKACTFNCLYCECGWTGGEGKTEGRGEGGTEGRGDGGTVATGLGLSGGRRAQDAGHMAQDAGQGDEGMHAKFPTREFIREELEKKLAAMAAKNDMITNITFAGNGEPTLHPEFPGIVDDVVELRNKYYPAAGISVLSNASLLNNDRLVEALMKVDQNILKLDAGTEKTFRMINSPRIPVTLENIISNLLLFNGQLIIQTLFIRGSFQGVPFDNTTDEEVTAWLGHIEKIRPQRVMIYPIARATPIEHAEKIPDEKLQEIAQRVEALGITAEVYH